MTLRVTSVEASSNTKVTLNYQRYDYVTRVWKTFRSTTPTLTINAGVGRVATRHSFDRHGPWRIRAVYSRDASTAPVVTRWKHVTVCGKKVIALTLDDGPDKRDTPVALDALRRYHARATFFVLGRRASWSPELIRRMCSDGHQIGNHSWLHKPAPTLEPEVFKSSVNRTNQAIYAALETSPSVRAQLRYPIPFRYPWGKSDSSTEATIKSLGMKAFLWTYACGDGGDHGPLRALVTNLIARKVINNAKPNGIILMHDGQDRPNSVAALPKILSALSKQGYDFVTIEDLNRLKKQ